MSRPPPRLEKSLHLEMKFFDLIQERDKHHVKTMPSRSLEGLQGGRRRHPDSGMRLLHRARPDFNATVFVKAALMIQHGLAPGLQDHLQVFLEPFAQLIQRNSKRESLPFHKAMADPELESSQAQTVERGVILGDPKRTVVWQQDHRGSDANFGGSLCYRSADDWGGRKETAEGEKVVFGKPDRIETELFSVRDLLNDRAQALASFCPSGRQR